MERKLWKPSRGWLNAYNCLYGEGAVVALPKAKSKLRRRRDEEIEQEKYKVWFQLELAPRNLRWFHCPNGGSRGDGERAKFARMGVMRGIPDIMIPVARNDYRGLVIELKRTDGRMSDLTNEQKDWLLWFREQKWCAMVAFGCEQAKKITMSYFYGANNNE